MCVKAAYLRGDFQCGGVQGTNEIMRVIISRELDKQA